MTPLFCVDITENRNNDRINGCDTELLEQRREDFREQFLWQQLTDLLRQAELDAKVIVSESETLQQARRKSSEIIRRAEERSKELYHVANTYTEDALRRTEEAIQAALDEVRESRVRYRSASAEQMQACQEKLKADPVKPSSEE